jgi:neopullulanase
MTTLSSSNGLGAIVWDDTQYKITTFLEHPYTNANASTQSRNFAYDSYPGIRIGTTGTWFTAITPIVVEYVPGTGIIHSQRSFNGLTLDEYDFAPMGLTENASVMLVEVTQNGSAGPIDIYSLFNYQVGTGSPTPSADDETLTYDDTLDAFYLGGPSGITMDFASISPSTYHGCTPNNPYGLLNAGENLMDDPGTGGATDGAVPGFQTSFGTMAMGSSQWVGWVTILSPTNDGSGDVTTARTWLNGRTADVVLSDEISAWGQWITPAPSGATALEAALDAESQAMIRMGQVTESGSSNGQILAAITPGEWTITWVRDMAYSTVALVKSGHYAEAKAAIEFQMNASVGGYQSYLSTTDGGAGVPYQISICRYYGDGTEWSDENSDGPNIEFDGFGLFLWALDEYVTASGDTTSLATWWPTVESKVANTLLALQQPSGLIAADSSIWEVHWDGQQHHFTYTTAAAANGLCSASRLATMMNDSSDATAYMTAGQKARDAIIANDRGPNGALGQSIEALASGMEWLDASTIEAINWGLIDPAKHTAQATMSSMLAGLVPPSGRGFMRDQTGAYYDSQEWVFIDLRSDVAFALGGMTSFASGLFDWNTDQGAENFNELSELHDATTADYAGAAPMVGFGAGAYIIALTDRGATLTPTCGAFAAEPSISADGGVDAGVDATGGFPEFDAGDAEATGADGGGKPHADAGGHRDGGHGGGEAGVKVDGAVAGDGGRGSGGHAGNGDGGTGNGSSGGCNASGSSGSPSLLAWCAGLLGLACVRRKRRAMIAGLSAASLAATGCSTSSGSGDGIPDAFYPEATFFDTSTGPSSDGGTTTPHHDARAPHVDASGRHEGGATPIDATPIVDVAYDVSTAACATTFTYTPPPGTTVSTVAVTGEWNGFVAPGNAMSGPDANGAYVASVALVPGLIAYKLIVNGQYIYDPTALWQKYISGVQNSAVDVPDCHQPALTVVDNTTTRPDAGGGTFLAHALFTPGTGAPAIDPSTLSATIRSNQVTSNLQNVKLDGAGTKISVLAENLADGKYTVFVNASDKAGQAAHPLRLVFWVEANAFEWEDTLMYMALTDRFKDGDPSNDPPPTPNVDPREDFQGGDYQGVQAEIENGTLDALGIRVLWLTPYNTNPPDAWIASDNIHLTMGYHGYWPIQPREVDPRWGGDTALKNMIIAAHAHGIRVIQDVVAHHIHQEHIYNQLHPDWFKTGCVCGTDNCDWTIHRLDCVFATYMPNVDWTNPDTGAQYEADSIWWVDQFDLDGFRIDAVKQVPDIAVTNLTAAVRGEYEKSGLRFFMTGETAMGWSNCDGAAAGYDEDGDDLSCNASQYDTINEYLGFDGLDGEFDFPLYYSVPLNDFAANYFGMSQADYWAQASGWEYVPGSIMTPYVGTQDTARFISIADYNDTPRSDGTSPYNQWTGIATAPIGSTPYSQLQLAFTWLIGLPGAPLIYYGDEYGQFGGVDPNNRLFWRGDGVLSSNEQATLTYMQMLGQARKNLVALRRGAYRPVYSDYTTLVFGRQDTAGDVALVALNTATTTTTLTTALPVTMPLADGTVLQDSLGGPSVTVSGGTVTLTLAPSGAAILAP